MLANVTIRLLSADDAAVLDRAHEDAFDEPVRPARLDAYLKDPGHLLMVAIDDGIVIAQVAAVIHRHPDQATELYIDEVGVAEPWRRRGLAGEMLRRMFEIGRETWLCRSLGRHRGRQRAGAQALRILPG